MSGRHHLPPRHRRRVPSTRRRSDTSFALSLVCDAVRADELPDSAVLRHRARRSTREDPVGVAVTGGVRRALSGRERHRRARRAARDTRVELYDDLVCRVRAAPVQVVLLVRADNRRDWRGCRRSNPIEAVRLRQPDSGVFSVWNA